MLREDAIKLLKLIMILVALALLIYSVILADSGQWAAATYFLVSAYAIFPFKNG